MSGSCGRSKVAGYVCDVKEQFLTCRFAPFSRSGAMLGYLLNGDTAEVFENIAQKLSCALDPVPEHASRNNRVSDRARTVPSGKNYLASFSCYHLILEYIGLSRASSLAAR